MDIIRTIGLRLASLVVTTAILGAMLVDALDGDTSTSTSDAMSAWAQLGKCTSSVHPALPTLEFVEARC
jgi:hypothetical protein